MGFPGTRESKPGPSQSRQRLRWWLLGTGALVATAAGVFVLSLHWLPPEGEVGHERDVLADIAASPGSPRTPVVPNTSKVSKTPSVVAESTPREPFFADPSSPPSSAADVIQEAAGVMARMIDDFPNLPDSLELRARFSNWRGEKAEAVKDWERCLELDPRYAHAYLGLARVAAAQGRYPESAELYRKAVEISSSFTQGRTELARVLINLGQAGDAIALLQKHSGAQSSDGHYLLGQAYTQQQDYEKACQHYQTATQLQPDYPDAYYGWATALARLGRRDEARQATARFQELNKEHLQAYRSERKEFDDLAAACGDIAAMYANMGRLYLTRGQAETAEELWRRAALLAPQNVECRQGLAWLYRQSGKTQDTVTVLRELAEMVPTPLIYWVEIGSLSSECGDFDAAEQAFRKACSADPEAAEGYASLAQLYLQANRKLDEAAELADKAAERSDTAEIHLLQAAILERQGDLPAARRALERALQRDPNNPTYLQMLGKLPPAAVPPGGADTLPDTSTPRTGTER